MTLTAYNNVPLPSLMYGTAWKEGATTHLVQLAVGSGFTAIDTANQLIHYREDLVGEALLALDKLGVKRETLFLQTKFTPVNGQDHRTPYDASADLTTQVQQSFANSLTHLHTDYVNSYILHGPYSRFGLGDSDREVWATMEDLYQSGKTKMIGISNVTAGQLTQLCEEARIKPMVVQNRCYASHGWDREVRGICQTHGIIYQGFSLLTANRGVMADPDIRTIAKRLGTNPAQVIFCFALQIGMLPLTGTTSQQHMEEDLQAESFSLLPEEIELIDTIGE
ncbi:MAG TPA: aldo/keto reductase [Nitrospirales bacterium]|nr:aldo/keto reductase [Nitrospirales bacterium]